MGGVGGKYGVLWARKNKSKKLPYTAEFAPLPTDLVEFNLKTTGSACTFSNPNYAGVDRYGGARTCYRPGAEIKHLGNSNDHISSVKVAHGLYATFYEHTNFRGRSWRVSGNHPKLHGWLNNRFSSMKVEQGRKTIKVPYSRVKKALPTNLQKFKVNGTITVDTTQATRTQIAAVPMTSAEVTAACNRPFGASEKKKRKKGAPVMVRTVPVSKNIAMKFKAPKSTGKRKIGKPMISAPAPK